MQYALQPGGVFLGSSETLVNERRPGNVGPASYRNGRRDDVAAPQPMSAVDHGDTTLLRAYAPPPAFLINQRHEVVHSYGDVRHILEIRPGAASLDLARLLPDNLATVAAAILFKLGRSGNSLTSNYVPLPAEGEHQGDTLYLLVFEEETARAAASDMVDIGSETAERIEILENELTATRESLQSTIEEMMASNDELQSVNEELNTVNAEYQEKIDILNRVNADLDSLTRIVSSGAVFVDPELRLTRFSPDASSIFRLREAGVGRPLSDLNHTLDYPGLITDLRRTLTDFTEVERQVAGPNGRRFLARFLPYRVPSSAERAAVLTFVDMTQSRNVQLLQSILDGLDAHISVLDCEGRIRMVNAAWNRFAQANGHADLAYSQPGTRYLDSCAVNPDIADHGDAERAVGGVRDERLDQRVMRDGVSLAVS
jgi:two-component system CheB/CheR fusion protein